MKKTDYVIDVQGFHDIIGEFLPKEIAVLGIHGNYIAHWMIKYDETVYNAAEFPIGILATNTFMTCYHHGIQWFEGQADLVAVYNALRDVARNTFCNYVPLKTDARVSRIYREITSIIVLTTV